MVQWMELVGRIISLQHVLAIRLPLIVNTSVN